VEACLFGMMTTTMMKGVVELIYLVIVERGLWGKGILLYYYVTS